ncbi:MAG TPA: hypothetical protein VGG39_36585 [Polyangiaceae bacterium]|jgi:hypothetical protein
MRPRAALFIASLVAGAAGSVGMLSCADAVHDQEVAALGPDVGPRGPTHRPGQPCLVCHGGEGPAKEQFSVAGTVYEDQGGGDAAVGAVVLIEDVTGRTQTPSTNQAGNFYVASGDWAPNYPTSMTVTSADGTVQQFMLSHVNRDGSCASCHALTEGPASPGPVYVNAAGSQGD